MPATAAPRTGPPRAARVAVTVLLAATTACAVSEPVAVQRALPASGTGTLIEQLGEQLTAGPSPSPSPTPTSLPPPPELPRGGRTIFPQHMVVMHYGTANTGVLGILGETKPDESARRLEARAAEWAQASGRPVLPAFELITSVAQRAPGRDGRYSVGLAHADVQRYLDAARAAKMLVVLDFQPGRARVLDQVKQYEKFLLEPEVGVAIDPEWALTPGQLPGKQIGRLPASEINAVSSYLSDLTVRNRLPEKIFLVHQFKTFMLPDRQKIVDRPGLALVFHVDGFGPRHSKRETYDLLSSKDGVAPGGQAHNGYKLFIDEDLPLQGAAEVMTLTPAPELVSYQ